MHEGELQVDWLYYSTTNTSKSIHNDNHNSSYNRSEQCNASDRSSFKNQRSVKGRKPLLEIDKPEWINQSTNPEV